MMPALSRLLCASLALLAAGAQAATDPAVWLATPAESGLHWQSSTGAPVPARIQHEALPLGSTWKLFAWLYLSGNNLQEKPYSCAAGPAQPGDEYCCEAGQQIDRDVALARSCGAYFAPQRLGLQAAAWQHWWRQQAPQSPWLADMGNMRPDYRVPAQALLAALAQVPGPEREQARAALIGRLLQPRWQDFTALAGSGYRFKTFTWDDPGRPGASLGGAAGWLANGQPFWIGGEGSSFTVMQRLAPQLPALLPLPAQAVAAGNTSACVDVAFFHHYPLTVVLDEAGQPLRLPGSLGGKVTLQFANGQRLPVTSDGLLTLGWRQQRPEISARFDLEQYVARVIDREGDAAEPAAARALAVAARSWLAQNAGFEHGCWQVDDDSHMQRVSPNPPTAAAWRAAWYTEGLLLQGQSVQYHQTHGENGQLSWAQAVQASRQGEDYVRILTHAFPHASLTGLGSQASCSRLPDAEQWLQRHLPQARQRLWQEPGFEPVDTIKVCQLSYGNPYSDQRQQSIWVRRMDSRDDRITLWHEYLHIAFRHHPNGWNEAYLENLARQLVDTI